jgi:hypothetical protein
MRKGRNRKRNANVSDAAADFFGFDWDMLNEWANRPKHVQFCVLVVAFARGEFGLQVLPGSGCLVLARLTSRAGI